MKSGETAAVECPNDLDLGGGIQNEYHSNFGFRWIDSKIDTKYKIKLLECGPSPEAFKKDHLEDLSPGYPFYFLSTGNNKAGDQMALTVDEADKYAPRTTGVHNVYLSKWAGRETPNLKQQWIWNLENQSFCSVGVAGLCMFEGFNKNVISYKWVGVPNQRWGYNLGTKRIANAFTGFAVEYYGETIAEGDNV